MGTYWKHQFQGHHDVPEINTRSNGLLLLPYAFVQLISLVSILLRGGISKALHADIVTLLCLLMTMLLFGVLEQLVENWCVGLLFIYDMH